jgi:hypothetical protein
VAYAEPNQQLAALVGDAGLDQAVEALEAASFEIDSAFASAGYATPLDTDGITDETTQGRFVAKLSTVCQALAGGILGSMPTKNRAVPGKVKKDRDIAKEWLAQVAKRRIEFPFLVRLKAGGVKTVGSSTWAATEACRDYQNEALRGC